VHEAGSGEAVPVDLDGISTDGCLRGGLGVGQLSVDDELGRGGLPTNEPVQLGV